MAHVAATSTRRRFVQASAAGSLALAGVGFNRLARAQAAKPNIVFIMADDLGYADVSCYGRATTPRPISIAWRSKELKFTQAYANSAICSPTRIGADHRPLPVCACRSGSRSRSIAPRPKDRPAAEPSDPAVAAQEGGLRHDAGRQMASRLPARLQPAQERLRPLLRDLRRLDRLFQSRQQSPIPLYEQEVPVDRIGYMTNLLGDRAVQTVERYARSKEPFLLSLHFTAPHWPWEGPDDEAESKRIAGRIRHHDGGTQKTYATMVQSLDANIGRVLQALDIHGLAANTIVIFTSDNGGERFSESGRSAA